MPPYSGIKVIHDQMIEESLERQRFYDGQEPPSEGLFKAFGKVFARFAAHARQQQAQPLPGCACQAQEAC